MKRIETLVAILVVGAGLYGLASIGLLKYMEALMQADGTNPTCLQDTLGVISASVQGITAVTCAIWLYLESQRQQCNRWIWGLLGLLFHLPGVAVFYGVNILETLKTNRNANQSSQATSEPALGAASSSREG